MPNKVGLLDTKVLGAQSSREAGFPEICRELRYIKGLLLAGTKLAFLSPQALP
jgi:hypothetical protein